MLPPLTVMNIVNYTLPDIYQPMIGPVTIIPKAPLTLTIIANIGHCRILHRRKCAVGGAGVILHIFLIVYCVFY